MEEERQGGRGILKSISNRKSAITIALVLLLFVLLVGNAIFWYRNASNDKETLKFGLITDVHCFSKFKKDLNEWDVNWRCERPMKEFVRQMNKKFKPDFVIETGDFVDGRDDRGEDGFNIAKSLYEDIKAPKYYAMGNHEALNMSKERWMEIVGYENTYYYFDIKNYRVVVLDASFYQNPDNPTEILDIDSETPEAWKGFINKEQLDWLDNALKGAGDLRKLVFIHQPPFSETIGREKGETFINSNELRTVLSGNGVLALFGGHIEEVCDVKIDGVRYFTFQGFHKTSPSENISKKEKYKDKGVFNQISIKDEQIDIEMFFSENKDQPYQSIKINQDTAVCNNRTLPVQE